MSCLSPLLLRLVQVEGNAGSRKAWIYGQRGVLQMYSIMYHRLGAAPALGCKEASLHGKQWLLKSGVPASRSSLEREKAREASTRPFFRFSCRFRVVINASPTSGDAIAASSF